MCDIFDSNKMSPTFCLVAIFKVESKELELELEQNVTILNLWPRSQAVIFFEFFQQNRFGHILVTNVKMVTNSNVTSTNLLLFQFRLNGLESARPYESYKNI